MKKPVQVFSYSILNSATDELTIHIDGEIVDASTQSVIKAIFGDNTTTSYKSFRNQLDASPASIYNVIINSVGGHVGDALAIHDLLVDLQTKGKTVNTIGRGIVASSATLILLAGKNPEMSANSWFMMHTVSGGAYGTVDQIENYAAAMRKFNDSIRDLYSEKSGIRKEEVTKLMNAETFLTAKDAKEKGFITTIGNDASFKNLIDKENWDFENEAVLNSYNGSVKPENQTDDMKKLFEDFKATIVAAIKGIPVTKDTDNQALVNSIADAVGSCFVNLGAQMEPIVALQVTDAITANVNAAVTAALAADATIVKKVDFDAKVTELETDITNKVGNASQAPANPGAKTVVPIGGF